MYLEVANTLYGHTHTHTQTFTNMTKYTHSYTIVLQIRAMLHVP